MNKLVALSAFEESFESRYSKTFVSKKTLVAGIGLEAVELKVFRESASELF